MAADAARLSLFSALARASADEAPLAEEDKRRFRSMLIAMTDAAWCFAFAERVVDLEEVLRRAVSRRPADERRALAEETTATFVPLASRLGVWSLKARLEDACFLRLNPREHAALARELEREGAASVAGRGARRRGGAGRRGRVAPTGVRPPQVSVRRAPQDGGEGFGVKRRRGGARRARGARDRGGRGGVLRRAGRRSAPARLRARPEPHQGLRRARQAQRGTGLCTP